MDYIKEYKSFINSHYLSEGVRITFGVALPAIIFHYFDMLPEGIVVSLGAMCVSVTDNAGPIHHRRNGMYACMAILFFVAIITGLAAPHDITMGIVIFIFCFIFSMIGVYGTRANSIGVAALLMMVLNIGRPLHGWEVLIHAAYVLAGGAWYTLLSLLLYRLRPYKLAQQALGDCVMATANYLAVRASFYARDADYEKIYLQMLEEQVALQEKQTLVRELLFKSRNIVKESTHTGRTLLLMFTETVDLFERAMTSYQDYRALHSYFDEDDILERYRSLILCLSSEMENIGIAIKAGTASVPSNTMAQQLKYAQEGMNDLRDRKRNADNVEGFVSLRQIMNSLEDISTRVHRLHLYTRYDKSVSGKYASEGNYDKFVSHQDITPGILVDNLSMKSNIFRHSLRVAIATIIGYIVSKFLPIGHSYWILLTIIVILKPAYSLTRKRNYERLLGTIGGSVIGLGILYFIKNDTVLFVLMLLLMVGTYSLLRTNYLLSVILMTPYILLLFHLLYSSSFQTVITDRVIDTAIGSAIAFLANFFLVPAWEKDQIRGYMLAVIEDNIEYFKEVSAAFTGNNYMITAYKVSRKKAFVSLANLSEAFTRMLAEPKSKQKNSQDIYQFVVLNHMLTSHIATLSYYVKPLAEKYRSKAIGSITTPIVAELKDAKLIIKGEQPHTETLRAERENILDEEVDELLEKRRNELEQGMEETITRQQLAEVKPLADQFNFIAGVTGDIRKLSAKLTSQIQ